MRSEVRVFPDPPMSINGAIAQLGEHLLCKQGVVGSIPTSSTKITSAPSSAANTVANVTNPSGCRVFRRAALVCHASGKLLFNNSWNRIEIVDGKSAGVKAFRHRAVNDIMIASTDIFIFEVAIRRI